MRHSTFLFCVCLLLLSSLSRAQPFAVHKDEVSFDLHGGYLVVVRGSLGKLEKRNFILDTGTNPSVLDERIARQLGLSGSKARLKLVNREIDTTTVLIPNIRVGPVSRQSLPMLVQNLSFLQRKLGLRIDALVGLDLLGVRSFQIDYASRRVIFGSTYPASGSVPFQNDPPLVTVEMMIENQPFRLLVDTGASGLILFDRRVRKKLQAWPSATETGSWNMSGQFGMREVQISHSRLGNARLGTVRAYLTEDRNHGLGFDGLIGIAVLRARQISFDFERRLFAWQTRNSRVPLITEAELAPRPSYQPPGAMSRRRAGVSWDF